ncbi:phosphatidylinositol 4,5-bisphosphate 3-kinase catalytic subunit delta isoform-like [Tubulanus polymorphus]|uniref:phosphatidylinositol 4,5-bisphosphate 3-kinase catalytic subunit delta isoform-like n=1 Tax=Tubulanus polymorphus TaxID=672921 RepID=UPI003DA44453
MIMELCGEFLPTRVKDSLSSQLLSVDFLLPTGILIPMKVRRDSSLTEIKQKLWNEAEQYPLFLALQDVNCYIFACINRKAEKEELVDETRCFQDIQLFYPMLKVIERKGNRDEKLLDSRIGGLIGKGLHEFDGMHSPEVSDFRARVRKVCEKIAERKTEEDDFNYYCSPEVYKDINNVPPKIAQHVDIVFQVYLADFDRKFMFRCNTWSYPISLIEQVLEKRANTTGMYADDANNYLLKICGCESYITGDYRLIQFKHVVSCIASEEFPKLVLVEKKITLERLHGGKKSRMSLKPQNQDNMMPPMIPQGVQKVVTTWEIEDATSVAVLNICNIGWADNTKVKLRMGIFHGGDSMCSIIDSKQVPLNDGKAVWDMFMTFDISVADLPRMPRLCIALYTQDTKCVRTISKAQRYKDSKMKQELVPLAWVNITMFDYKDRLRTGNHTLRMWPYSDEFLCTNRDFLNPIGTIVDNPNKADAPVLEISFSQYGMKHNIIYPPYEKVLECAAQHAEYDQQTDWNESTYNQLKEALSQDPLQTLHQQDMQTIWKCRLECREYFPHALPRLLSCVQWNKHTDVAQMQALLRTWPSLPAEHSLELLDYCYADKSVRRFAVDCIKTLSDEELLQYLLQLVQAQKYESYLECDLVEFLLTRALESLRIGHYFFWLLRSEMHSAEVSVQFGLLLEAYCRGARRHITDLTRQHTTLCKLQELNEQIKTNCSKMAQDKAIDEMRMQLNEGSFSEVLSDIHSPLDPKYYLKHLQISKCKFMDSKMKPLFMVWKNEDPYGDDVYFIFKNGDDLRQDMLTIQILKIMDNIWQSEGLDLRLKPYNCIATGSSSGLIEVVRHAQTLANIHVKYKNPLMAAAFNKYAIYTYLKEHNKDEESLSKALEEFTFSCAGYCVATYVLGIGDRHSGNIMVTEGGRLFHIDFGHFLGNFKSKFGIKRERVPFVLTPDFIQVIQKGNKKTDSFPEFQKICERAFAILRSKGNFLISLFMLMMSTGIPELSGADDIHYLRDTLAVNLTDEEALKHFRNKFNDAIRNGWKTQLNWVAHNVAHA